MSESTEYEADAPNPADVINERQQEQAMWRALQDVPDTYREPLVLFYREGQSAKQVAAALGISAGAVEQRLSRGRKHLREGVTELIAAGLARTAAPAAGFTAAVMAGITALPGQAAAAERATDEADAGRPHADAASASVLGAIVSSPGWLALGVGVVAVAAAIALRSSPSTDDEAASPDAVEEVQAAASPTATDPSRHAREQWAAQDEARSQAADDDKADAESRLPQPSSARVESYELSVMSPRQVAVALDGGATKLTIFPGRAPAEPPPVVRRWTGRVVDASGDAVSGAVVVAGPYLRKALGNSITASAGAVSDDDGRFEIPLYTDEPAFGLAMRSGNRWSGIEALGPGDANVARDVVVGSSGGIHGRVTRGGRGVIASVMIEADGVNLHFVTEEDGRFVIAPLPTGALEVHAREGGELVLSGTWVQRSITLGQGDDVPLDFELPVGSLVAFDLVPPEGVDFQTVTYSTLSGVHTFDDVKQFRAAYDAAPPEQRYWILHGGVDLDDPAQLEDVPTGPLTACVHGEHVVGAPPGEPRPPKQTVFFACRVVEVGGPGTVTPVEFEL